MIQLSDSELSSFRRRCEQAARNGYHVAHGLEYADVLMGELGISEIPGGMKKGSAAHLSHLAGAVQALRLAPPAEPKPGLVSLKSEPVAEEPPKPETAPGIDLHKEVPISELALTPESIKLAEEALFKTEEAEALIDLHKEVPISVLKTEEAEAPSTEESVETAPEATSEAIDASTEEAQKGSKKGRRKGR